MTLFDHLDELRKRVFLAVAAWLVASGVMFVFRFEVIEWLKRPLPDNMTLSYFSLLEPFITSMQVASFFGLVVAAPVLIAQVWGFLAPGLYQEERKYAVPFILLAALAFALGVAFAYYVVLPFTVPILLSFLGEAATGFLSIGRYIGNLIMLMGVFGLMFELPVVAFLLARIGLIRAPMLVATRRYAIVILLVLAAAMSPSGDPFNFALVAGPLLVLYEVSIIVVRFAQRPERRGAPEPDPL